MKFSKQTARYVSESKLPSFIWIYECQTCALFQPPGLCALVDEKGEPDPGFIQPKGWCGFWIHKLNDLPFSYLFRSAEEGGAGQPRVNQQPFLSRGRFIRPEKYDQ